MPEETPPAGGPVEAARIDEAPVHFHVDGRLQAVPTGVYQRFALAVGSQLAGPAMLLQDDTTLIVPPGAHADVLASGDLRITT
jgi:N-methylhydantoinase A